MSTPEELEEDAKQERWEKRRERAFKHAYDHGYHAPWCECRDQPRPDDLAEQ